MGVDARANDAGPAVEAAHPVQVRGTAFVEFAGPDTDALIATLHAIGFRRVARHPSRAIVLMRQGEIDVFVNAEPGSHAMRFAAMHGPSCAGMAFLVDDAGSAVAGALGRGAERLATAGSSLLPDRALSGIGASALYLIDPPGLEQLIGAFDFAAVQPEPEAASPFIRIDHLTHCVRPGEMARWVDFYKTIFGFDEVFKFVAGDASNGFDTIAVRDRLNNACVTVLEPIGSRSQIQEFIDEYRGEGIQHLALLSGDLYRSVERMRDAGVEFLPTPGTYYEAVDQRLPDHGEDLTRMRALGMLIDGAATGESPDEKSLLLLQIFTRKLVGPIFFEAIQRKGNRGFGEGNAKALFEAIKREQEQAA